MFRTCKAWKPQKSSRKYVIFLPIFDHVTLEIWKSGEKRSFRISIIPKKELLNFIFFERVMVKRRSGIFNLDNMGPKNESRNIYF